MMKVNIWKVVLGLAIVALLVSGSAMLYRAGYARGAMSELSFEDTPFANGHFEDGAGTMPYGGLYGMRGYYGYSRFSLGRMLFGGFVFFLIAGGIFRLFRMRRYGYGVSPRAMRSMCYEGEGASPWMRHHPYWGKMPPEEKNPDQEK